MALLQPKEDFYLQSYKQPSELKKAKFTMQVILFLCIFSVAFAVVALQNTLLGLVCGVGGLVVGYECVYALFKLKQKEEQYATHTA